INDQPYHVFVLSVAAAGYDQALSAPSEEITLTTEDTTIAVYDISALNVLHVYPNPVHAPEELRVQIKNMMSDEVLIEITDATGTKIFNTYHTFEDELKINVSKLPAGIYFLHSSYNNVSEVIRFIKN
ncbi:MAG: T9SS type A sorting domain-containing protein, partial [Chitinophagales bacterium]|nr:T9SS type A sorting domain-containing protein [Chitinophagales bacterium]